MRGPDDWVAVSDLAEYAFCPRAHWYRTHAPPEVRDRRVARRSREGERYHARHLAAERRHAEFGAVYWGALLGGAALVLGALAWILRP